MKPSFFKRVKRAIKREIRRIKDEHRSTRSHRKKPPLSFRFNRWLNNLKQQGISVERKRPPKPHGPSPIKRFKHYVARQRKKYAVVFSSKFLIITLNSTVLYLVSFFLIHFLTHLVTGITSFFCDISTTLNYTFVDFHIRYWNWTEEMVIIVFSVPALFTVLISLLASLAFTKREKRMGFWKRLRTLTKRQRHKHKKIQRQKELEIQVQRLSQPSQPPGRRKIKKRLSWMVRLFLLWTLYHSTTYFFSGMLYSFLFHRRFGYVIWYAFNSYFFDMLFSLVAFLSMVAIGYIFSVQFFYSARMYLNDLNDRNRMPFVVSQAIFPFFIGIILTTAMQVPHFDPAVILLNFSIFFLLLPLPSRAARFDSLHFDSREKIVKINWKWAAWSALVVISIFIATKIGIQIRLP